MATKVVMEALSPTMEEGRLVKWNKAVGDAVKGGDVLAEVETDKAVMELVARGDGLVRKILVPVDTTTPVGTLLAVIGTADEDISALLAGASAAAPAAAPAATPAATPAASSSSRPSGAAASGETSWTQAPPPPVILSAAKDLLSAPPAAAPAQPAGAERSSPLARRLAADSGVSLGAVAGSGPGGRIIKRDIEAALAGSGASSRPSGAAASGETSWTQTPSGPGFRDIPLTQLRKTIARRLAESIGPIPTFYLTAEYDLDRVTEMRLAMAELGDDYKVSVNDILLKAVATALSQHPEVNAHWLGDRIRQHDRVHLGMAVATDDGLIVPVIFDAQAKRMRDISREAKALATRARERKLTPAEYTGSTFSVSNLGMFGIDQFTAIINPPECGILAIGTASDQVVLDGGTMRTRKVLRVTMSCDHRAIDGAVGARFLQTLRRMIENPLLLVY